MLRPSAQIGLVLGARWGAEDTGGGHRLRNCRCVGISPHYWCRIQVIKIELLRSRDSLQTCPERRLQRQSSLWHRHRIRGADLFHDALDEEIEDLQLTVEGHDELLIRLNPYDKLWKDVMPEDDIDPAALGNVELTLELRPKAL